MPAADGRMLNRNYDRPRPRGFAAEPGEPVDIQSITSGHPPGALLRAGRRLSRRFAMTEHAHAGCSSRRARRAVRSNAAREKPVFVNPAPWSLPQGAPAAGTKKYGFRFAA